MKKDGNSVSDPRAATRIWLLVGAAALTVFGLMLTGSVLIIGERLARLSPWLEIVFYLALVVLAYALLVRPIVRVVRAPSIPMDRLLGSGLDRGTARRIARGLLRTGDLSREERATLQEAMRKKGDPAIPLAIIVTRRVEEMNGVIREYATLALVSTAISQSGALDGLAALLTNIRLVNRLVRLSGFRPGYPQLVRMYANVFLAALVATSLEDFDEIGDVTGGILGSIPGARLVASSLVQGLVTALLTLRVGFLTRQYIITAGRGWIRTEARRSANKEALHHLIPVAKNAALLLPGFLKNFAKKFSGTIEKNTPSTSADF